MTSKDVLCNDEKTNTETPKYSLCVMSKKRYLEIQKCIESYFPDNRDSSDEIMSKIRDIMKYNLNSKQYNRERGKEFREKRKQQAQEAGISQHNFNCLSKREREKRI